MFFPKQFIVRVLTAIKCVRLSLGWCVRLLWPHHHLLSFPFTLGSFHFFTFVSHWVGCLTCVSKFISLQLCLVSACVSFVCCVLDISITMCGFVAAACHSKRIGASKIDGLIFKGCSCLQVARSLFSAPFSPNSLLWGSLFQEKKAGRDMPWPCLRALSAMCLLLLSPSAFESFRLWPRHAARVCPLSALCQLFVCLCPGLSLQLGHVPALCPLCVRHVFAFVHCMSASVPFLSRSLCSRAWRCLCPVFVCFCSPVSPLPVVLLPARASE